MSGQELLGTHLSNEVVGAISFVFSIVFCMGGLKLAQVYYDWIDRKEISSVTNVTDSNPTN